MDASTLSLVFAGLSVGTAAIFHIIGLRNAERARRLAIETRQAQFVNDIYDELAAEPYWSLSDTVRSWQWTDYDDFMEKFGPKTAPDEWRKLWVVCARWEHVGLLVRDRIIEPELVWHWMGARPIVLWTKFEPIIREYRAREEPEPKGMVFEWFEDLVAVLRQERDKDRALFPERLARRELLAREDAAKDR